MSFARPAYLAAVLSAFFIPGALNAGIPVEEELRCPFGNETVTYSSTMSCSDYGSERHMSFAPSTSCEFIEHLPQCAKTKLPLYREFSRPEVKVLRQFAKTEEYAAAAAISRFYLAYVIETKLVPENSSGQFDLLLGGLWHDSAQTYGNAAYFEAFAAAANKEITAGSAEDRAFVMAVSSYAALMMGKVEKARELVRAVRKSEAAKDTILLPYVTAVEKCVKSPRAESCQPDALINLGN